MQVSALGLFVMTDFTLNDLEVDISQSARNLICDVVLSWARLDSLVSQMVLTAFGLAVDGGTILLGQMDTKTKLDRLKLYDHHSMGDAAQSIANLRLWHKKYVDVRNTISHHTCAGSWKSDPAMLVFSPVRARQGELRQVDIEHIALSQIRAAEVFARNAANALMVVVEQLTSRNALRPPEPPVFLSPNPSSVRKSGEQETQPPLTR
jgi:hypothetical protein